MGVSLKHENEPAGEALASIRAESGVSLLALAETSPVLLVFLRHFGCSFCRQTLSDVGSLRPELEARGVRPVFVHLGTPERAKPYFEYYGLADVERISDPDAVIYQHPLFALARTHPLSHLFNARVWVAWLKGALFAYGIGTIREDAHQMPGLFYLKGPLVVRRYRYRTIADEPDYLKLIS
jgi:hypothetical protein